MHPAVQVGRRLERLSPRLTFCLRDPVFAAQETPKTLSKEWQSAANEKLLEQGSDPFTGVSSKGYQGKVRIVRIRFSACFR